MKSPLSSSRAFSLVEVTLALGIFGFCLLAIFGLLPVGLGSNQASVEQTAASDIATMLAADLRTTKVSAPPVDQTSPLYQISVPASSGTTQTLFFRKDGKLAGAVNADANPTQDPFFRAMLKFSKDPKGTATIVRMLITWPALGDSKASATPKNFSGSFETVIALDRT